MTTVCAGCEGGGSDGAGLGGVESATAVVGGKGVGLGPRLGFLLNGLTLEMKLRFSGGGDFAVTTGAGETVVVTLGGATTTVCDCGALVGVDVVRGDGGGGALVGAGWARTMVCGGAVVVAA